MSSIFTLPSIITSIKSRFFTVLEWNNDEIVRCVSYCTDCLCTSLACSIQIVKAGQIVYFRLEHGFATSIRPAKTSGLLTSFEFQLISDLHYVMDLSLSQLKAVVAERTKGVDLPASTKGTLTGFLDQYLK